MSNRVDVVIFGINWGTCSGIYWKPKYPLAAVEFAWFKKNPDLIHTDPHSDLHRLSSCRQLEVDFGNGLAKGINFNEDDLDHLANDHVFLNDDYVAFEIDLSEMCPVRSKKVVIEGVNLGTCDRIVSNRENVEFNFFKRNSYLAEKDLPKLTSCALLELIENEDIIRGFAFDHTKGFEKVELFTIPLSDLRAFKNKHLNN